MALRAIKGAGGDLQAPVVTQECPCIMHYALSRHNDPFRSLFSALCPLSLFSIMSWRVATSIYLVWSAFFLDCLVLTVIIPIIPSYLAKLKVSQTAIGVLFASKVQFPAPHEANATLLW